MHLKKIVPFRNVSIFLVLVLLILLLAGCQPGDSSGTGTTAKPQDPSRSTAGSHLTRPPSHAGTDTGAHTDNHAAAGTVVGGGSYRDRLFRPVTQSRNVYGNETQ